MAGTPDPSASTLDSHLCDSESLISSISFTILISRKFQSRSNKIQFRFQSSRFMRSTVKYLMNVCATKIPLNSFQSKPDKQQFEMTDI